MYEYDPMEWMSRIVDRGAFEVDRGYCLAGGTKGTGLAPWPFRHVEVVMAKVRFDEIREAIKHRRIHGRQFSQFAKQVAAALDRDAVEIREKLEEALKAIQIAEEFRGESGSARAEALELIDQAEKAANRRQNRRQRKS
jgi:hypothetical protein